MLRYLQQVCFHLRRTGYQLTSPNPMVLTRFQRGSAQVLSSEDEDSLNSSDLEKSEVYLSSESEDVAPYSLSRDQENFVTQGDSSRKLKLNTFLMELYVKRQKGASLPQKIKLDELLTLIHLKPFQLSKNMQRLYIHEELKKKRIIMKEERKETMVLLREEREEALKSMEYPWLSYRLFGNALLPRIFPRAMNNFSNLSLDQGRRFGQNIVFDCSYNAHMRDSDIKNAAKQLILSIQQNKDSRRPYNMIFCNIQKNDKMFYYLKRFNPQIDHDVPVLFSEKNYFELFPKKNLVYLSPHCQTDLQYNPNHVYIVGVIVDKVDSTPLSAAKARQDGIPLARLPIDKYVRWQKGSKSLCINQVSNIIHMVKDTGSWVTALESNLPVRKLIVPNPGFRKKITYSNSTF